MWLYRLLDHPEFHVDDRLWRCHIKIVFQMLVEQGELVGKENPVLINVDFTSDRDDFLILCASVLMGDNAVPIYFSMRNYPRRKNQMDQKKMEKAFIKALRHLLPDKYRYIVVADRGFGNDRFIGYCQENGFDTMIRVEPNMRIALTDKQGIMADILDEDGLYSCVITAWKKPYIILRHSQDNKVWYILSNIKNNNVLNASIIYKKRFKIEKLFQNLKSSGFAIEKSKIRKYIVIPINNITCYTP